MLLSSVQFIHFKRQDLGPLGQLCGKTNPPAKQTMGRSKNYRSPSNIKRSAKRLVSHLHKLMAATFLLEVKAIGARKGTQEMKMGKLAMVDEYTSDTFTTFHHKKIHSFHCSTPKKPRNICDDCKMSIFERFIEVGTLPHS